MSDLSREEVDAKLAASEAKVDARLASFDTTVKTGFSDVRRDMDTGFAKIRSEISEIRAEMHKGTADIVKWIIGTAIAMGATGIVVITFVLNNAVPKGAPAATPPIVIQSPAAPAPQSSLKPFNGELNKIPEK